MLFRVEGPDQEYLESIITKVSELLPSPDKGATVSLLPPVDTETKFIRTTAASAPEVKVKIEKWAKRGELKGNRPYFYVEFFVEYFDDIDLIAKNVIANASRFDGIKPVSDLDALNTEFKLVELLRLWGKPAIYALLRNERSVNPEDIYAQIERVKTVLLEWCRNGTPLKSEPGICVQPCTHFAAVELPLPLTYAAK